MRAYMVMIHNKLSQHKTQHNTAQTPPFAHKPPFRGVIVLIVLYLC